METKSAVGDWFKVIQSRGDDMYIRFGQLGEANLKWFECHHSQFDGVGAFTSILRERGFEIPQVPRDNQTSRPPFWRRIWAVVRYLILARIRHVNWKKVSSQRRGRSIEIAWHFFGPDETLNLNNRAKANGASLNSLLLWSLNKSVAETLVDNSKELIWMIPVNLRGLVRLETDTENHSSYLGVNLFSHWPVSRVHQEVRNCFSAGDYWASWKAMNWVGKMGQKKIEKALSRYEKKFHCWAGTFSNLGSWPPPHSKKNSDLNTRWLFAVPVSRSNPIGGACMIWNGQLGLTLQVHPSLTVEPDVIKSLMEHWRKSLTEEPLKHSII